MGIRYFAILRECRSSILSITKDMLEFSWVKYSGGKIFAHSDFWVRATKQGTYVKKKKQHFRVRS
jgi:hypothetical protein